MTTGRTPMLKSILDRHMGSATEVVPDFILKQFGNFDLGAERAGLLHLVRNEQNRVRLQLRLNAEERRVATRQLVTRMYQLAVEKHGFTHDQMTEFFRLLGVWDKNRMLTPEFGGDPRPAKQPKKKRR